jgi:hypothetical protein
MYVGRLYFLSRSNRILLLHWVLLRDIVEFDGLGGDDCVALLGIGYWSVASEAAGAVRQAVLV